MKFCGLLVVLVFFMTLWSIECRRPPFPTGCGDCAATICPYVSPESCPGVKNTRDKCGCCTVCKEANGNKTKESKTDEENFL